MATATRTIGPADDGLRMTWEDFSTADWEEGYRYELIDGRLVVAAAPNIEHDEYFDWIDWPLKRYSRVHPEVINRVSSSARVFIPGRPDETVPQPDLAAYQGFPSRKRALTGVMNWRKVSPLVVVEIMSPDSTDKDLFRNVELYEAVPSIREYWIVDGRGEVEEMIFRVYRKRGSKWQKPIDFHYGDTYTTKLLPGFSLLIDPLA
jgi:Uma2 family endonuclease